MEEASQQLEISCESCGAKTVVEAHLRTSSCPYCDSPSVIDRTATSDRPDPVFAIGFAIDRHRAGRLVRRFLGRKKMAPFGIERAAAEKVHGVYVPAYLFSALAVSRFAARIGEDYWVTEVSRDSKGRTRVRRRRKTELCDLQGPHRTYLGDVLVTASGGIANHEMEAIEPYRPRRATEVHARIGGRLDFRGAVAGSGRVSDAWPARKHRQGWPDCCGRSCRVTASSTSVTKPTLDDESADLTLLPVWVFAMRYDGGQAPGSRPGQRSDRQGLGQGRRSRGQRSASSRPWCWGFSPCRFWWR